ncbi:MAG TPA: DUF456 family protein [Chthoniobacterales bacterium]
MQGVWWTVTVLLMAAGVIGTVLPLVPGHVLVLAGALVHKFAFGEAGVSWWAIAIMAVLLLAGAAVDFLSGAAGAKYFGATRWGAIGGLVGAIAGVFFGLPGIIIGPLVGVLAGELLSGKGLLPAGKSTWGSLLGAVAGGVLKFLIALIMIGVFAIFLIFQR